MCVGLPARVMKIQNGMALVDASGAKREVSAALIDELDPGDYVMVHAGMAIARLPIMMPTKPTISWRNWTDGRSKEADGPGYHPQL